MLLGVMIMKGTCCSSSSSSSSSSKEEEEEEEEEEEGSICDRWYCKEKWFLVI